MTAPPAPSGTITFLFTDIEGSTRLWQAQPRAMAGALRVHDDILRRAITAHDGYVFKTVGDAFCAAFPTAEQAVAAALDAQRALQAETWPQELGPLRVRMGIHSGTADERDGDYFGPTVNRVARLHDAGHGGQVLLSDVAAGLVRDHLPRDVALLDLGAHWLKDLAEPQLIYQLSAPDLPQSFPPLRALDAARHHLPLQATSLIGREQQVAEVTALLQTPGVRLVTLTGTGGTGKTRLALQVGEAFRDAYAHGVHFVDLSPIKDAGGVVRTIISALEISARGQEEPETLLINFLSRRHTLLILDNFEQVIAAAPLVAELLRRAPRLQVLVTSRESLLLSGEHEYPVPPLSLPDVVDSQAPAELLQYEAIALFVARARAVRPAFELDESNARAVAAIATRLDGLPLAIELAAARSRLFTPQALLDRLDDRLKALTSSSRDLPARQRTLRGAIDWSYDLLDAGEQQLFRRLAVFSGGWTLDAAEAVCGPELPVDVLEGLESLLNKSLIRRAESAADEPRFTMLETIGEYARERLAEGGSEQTLRERHAAYYAEIAAAAAEQFRGPEEVLWLNRLDLEIDNLRAALNFCLGGGDVGRGVAMATGLRDYWLYSYKHAEGEEVLRRALAARGQAAPPVQIDVLTALALILAYRNKLEDTRPLLAEAATKAAALGDQRRLAWATIWEPIAGGFDDPAAYVQAAQSSIQTLRMLGEWKAVSQGLNILGEVQRVFGDSDAAEAAYLELIPLAEKIGDNRRLVMQYANLASLAYERQDGATILHYARLGLPLALSYRVEEVAAFFLLQVGVVAAWQGRHLQAAQLAGASDGWYEDMSVSRQPYDMPVEQRMRAAVKDSMGDATFQAGWQKGRAMPLRAAVAFAEREIDMLRGGVQAAKGS